MSPAYAQAPVLPSDILQQLPDAAKPGPQQEAFLYPELEPEPGKYIVPPVVDRPLGVTEGPRIKIEAFELRGAVDRPENGLKLDEIWAIIEKDRARLPEGHSIGQLQELANQITALYREKGFIVAHAFIPVQTVEDGIVTIQVLEGVLGRVLVEGNNKYKPESLVKPFASMVGQPLVNNEVEGALIRLSDYPGLTSFGVFQPGQEVGNSDLVIKVQEEKPMDVLYSFDNNGSRFTGQYQNRLDIAFNNIFTQADKLEFAIEHSLDPDLSNLVSFDYSMQLFKPEYRLEFGQENSDFELDDNQIDLAGIYSETRLGYLRFRNNFERGRTRNSYWVFGFDRKTARTFQDENRLGRDNLAIFSFEYGFDSLDIETQSFQNFVINVSHGENCCGAMSNKDEKTSRRLGSGDYASSRFDKLTMSYARLATLSPTRSLLIRAAYQYTENALVGLEQFAMGGMDNVRAYPVSEATMDRGIFVSAEHIWNAPFIGDKVSPFDGRKWGQILTVSAFVDFAEGDKVDPLENEEKYANFKGWGVGSQLAVPGSFTTKLTAAWPFMDSTEPTNKRKPQVFLSLEADVY